MADNEDEDDAPEGNEPEERAGGGEEEGEGIEEDEEEIEYDEDGKPILRRAASTLDFGVVTRLGKAFKKRKPEGKPLTVEDAMKCFSRLAKVSPSRYAFIKLNVSSLGLTDISVLPRFTNIAILDLSQNRLTSFALNIITFMPNLLAVHANANLLTTARVSPLPLLQVLQLNKNQIPDVNGVYHPSLNVLELNNNVITDLDEKGPLNPHSLKHLRCLALRGNQLTHTGGINLYSLQALFLAQNQITKIQGLEVLVNLKTLNLRENHLENLDGFSPTLVSLKYLNLRKNRLTQLSEIEKLTILPALEILVTLGNEFEGVEEGGRAEIFTLLPQLTRIDKKDIDAEDRGTVEDEDEEGGEEEEE